MQIQSVLSRFLKTNRIRTSICRVPTGAGKKGFPSLVVLPEPLDLANVQGPGSISATNAGDLQE
jgi:hypothetical protein